MSGAGGDPAALGALADAAPDMADDLRTAASDIVRAAADWNAATTSTYSVDASPAVSALRGVASLLAELDGWAGQVGDAFADADAQDGVPNPEPTRTRLLAQLLDGAPTGADLVVELLVDLDDNGVVTRADLVGIEVEDLSRAGQDDRLSLSARNVVNRTAIDRWLQTQPRPGTDAFDDLGDKEQDQLTMLRRLVGEDTPPEDLAWLYDQEPLTVLRFVPVEGPDDEPTLQVAYGDLASADHALVWVPGTTHGVHTLEADLREADRLRLAAAERPGRPDLAVVIDLYDAPDNIAGWDFTSSAARPAFGDQHADALAALVHTVDDAVDPTANVTLLGHSYGSYAAGKAALEGVPVDDLVLIGSPGTGAGHADDFDLEAGAEVWTARTPKDSIEFAADADEYIFAPFEPDWFALGVDPVDESFGAQVFEVNHPDAQPGDGSYTTGHGGYLAVGSQSLTNIATIAVDGMPTVPQSGDVDDRIDEVDAPGPGFIDSWVAGQAPEWYVGTDATRAEDGG